MADGLANPTIALGVRGAEGSAQQTNPLELMRGIVGTQQGIVDLQSARQVLAARQKAGEIMANAPDLESGIAALQKDPTVSGFAPEILSSFAGTNSALVQAAGAQQGQNESGLSSALKLASSAIADPSMLGPSVTAALKTMSPAAQKAVGPAMTQLVSALTDGLPSDPAQAKQVYQRRLAATSMAVGFDGNAIRETTGTMAPSISMQPVGPGGASVPVQTGGPVTGGNGPQIVGQPSAPIQTLTPEQVAAQSSKGAQAGELSSEMGAKSQVFPQLHQIEQLQGALSNFQSGGFADIRANVGQFAQGLKNIGMDIDDKTINKISNGSLSETEFFDSAVKPFVTRQLQQAAAGTGNVMLPEVNAFINSMDSTKDPATVMKLLNNAKWTLQQEFDQSQKYIQFKQMLARKDPSVEGLEESDFKPWYSAQFDPNKLPGATPGGMNLGQTAVTEAKGAVAPPDKKNRPALDSFFK